MGADNCHDGRRAVPATAADVCAPIAAVQDGALLARVPSVFALFVARADVWHVQ